MSSLFELSVELKKLGTDETMMRYELRQWSNAYGENATDSAVEEAIDFANQIVQPTK